MAEVNVRVSDSGRLFPDAVVIKVDEQEIIAGQDGISPVVTVTEIGTAEAVSSHGYEVDVSDAAGVHTYSVYDGASAYAQAVAGGYSGTEEEFAADLIGFNTRAAEATAGATAAAVYADAASDSATAAATSESNAADSATAAASSASEAASSAGTATTAAGSASSSATAAAGSATTASNKASEAASSESNAASSATAASASATAAAASETAAASSASSAAGSATAAAASAAAIEEYEHDAEAWAIGKRGGVDVDSSDDTYHNNSKYYAEQAAANNSAAAQKANEATSSAQAASQSAQDAAASATAASQSASGAENSATAASGSASTASTAAATAQGHATNAASSATAASGSATSASNSATAAAASATAAGNAKTAAETAQGLAEDAQEAAEAVLESIPSDYTELSDDVDDLKSAKAPVIVDTASGTIASFEDGADSMPFKSLTVNIKPVQAAGTPTPENPLPITGWTGANVTVNGTSLSITFPSEAGTVYGGTLDVISGLLTVDRIMLTKNTSAMNNTKNYPGWKDAGVSICVPPDFNGFVPDSICSILPSTRICINMESGAYYDTLFFSGSGYTQTRLKEFAIDCQFVLPLLSPISYQLTPTELTTLLGINNIWADCGPVSVDYPADTKLFIQKVNKPTDDDMIADAQIASGKYFIVGNNLYLSTTTIPAGDTIIPGTNCTQTNLAEALNALNT